MVEFISYTGKFPNLCGGILTLEIDGKFYDFGATIYDECVSNLYPKFWMPGTYGNFNKSAEWEYDGGLPPFLEKFQDEIMRVFNENVPLGCCGGCL